MPRQPNPKPDDAEQTARFIENAKLVDANKSGKVFEKAVEAIIVKREKEYPAPANPSQRKTP